MLVKPLLWPGTEDEILHLSFSLPFSLCLCVSLTMSASATELSQIHPKQYCWFLYVMPYHFLFTFKLSLFGG